MLVSFDLIWIHFLARAIASFPVGDCRMNHSAVTHCNLFAYSSVVVFSFHLFLCVCLLILFPFYWPCCHSPSQFLLGQNRHTHTHTGRRKRVNRRFDVTDAKHDFRFSFSLCQSSHKVIVYGSISRAQLNCLSSSFRLCVHVHRKPIYIGDKEIGDEKPF